MTDSSRAGPSRARLGAVAALLLAAAGGALLVPLYARSAPRLGSFPFFYWYQLACVPAVSAVCWLCWALLRPRPGPGAGRDGGAAPR
jgi:hypothetical protein